MLCQLVMLEKWIGPRKLFSVVLTKCFCSRPVVWPTTVKLRAWEAHWVTWASLVLKDGWVESCEQNPVLQSFRCLGNLIHKLLWLICDCISRRWLGGRHIIWWCSKKDFKHTAPPCGYPGGVPLPELLLDVLELPSDESEKTAHMEKLKELKQSLWVCSLQYFFGKKWWAVVPVQCHNLGCH